MREISPNFRLFWRILKDIGEIEVVMRIKGTGYAAVGWRPKDATKSCQKWPKIGLEADDEADAEAEGEAEAEDDIDVEAEAESSKGQTRVEKSIDVSIGYVKSSISTGELSNALSFSLIYF